MTRILQVLPSFAIGGAERCVVQLMCALDRCRFEISAVSLYARQNTELEEILEKHGFPVTFLGKKPGPDLAMFHGVGRIIREFRPHVIHTHLHAFNYVIPAILGGIVQGAVHTVHSVAERERRRLVKWLPNILFSRAVAPVAIAGEVQASIRRVFGVDSVLIPNGIPVDMYRSGRIPRAEWRKRAGFNAGDVLFVCVGRLDPVKNHKMLIDAFAAACRDVAHAHLLLVGDGELQQQLKQQVEVLHLNGRVHFLGIQNDVPSILGASDIYAFASHHEGSPLSIMEALASGLPIVGTAVGGVPEMVPEGAGILTSPSDSDSLILAMKVVRGDNEQRARMRRAAAQSAARFDLMTMANAYGALYARLVEQRKTMPRGQARIAPVSAPQSK